MVADDHRAPRLRGRQAAADTHLPERVDKVPREVVKADEREREAVASHKENQRDDPKCDERNADRDREDVELIVGQHGMFSS